MKNEKKSGGNFRAEAFDLMQNYYRTAHRPLIRCMIRFSGHLEEDALKSAVSASVAAVPQIACRYDPASRSWKAAGNRDMVRIVPENGKDTAEKLLLSSVDFEKGPQTRLFLVRGKREDTLCVVMSHLVMDGGGFKEYLSLLAELYSCWKERRSPPVALSAGNRSLGQLFQGYSLREKWNVLTSRSEPVRQDPSSYPPLQGDRERSFWVRCVLEKELFSAVCSFGRRKGASVNDMLLTAYARALRNWTGKSHVEFPCPVDLRKYRKNGTACGLCNLTGNFRCAAEILPDEPFEETLRRISAQLTVQKNSTACLRGPLVLNFLFRILPARTLSGLFPKIFKIPVVSYTNIGILDDERLVFRGTEVKDAFFVTAAKYAPSFQVSVTTWRGTCSLTSAFHGTPDDEAKIRRFLDSMKRELSAAVSGIPA